MPTFRTQIAGAVMVTSVVAVAFAVFSRYGAATQSPSGGPDPARILPAFRNYLEPPKHVYDLESSYLRWPLPESERVYASIDGAKMKADVRAITAISRKSRDDGNRYWGRIAGTPYDAQVRDWVERRYREIGLQDVRQQEFDLPPQWRASSWSVTFIENGREEELTTAFPFLGSPATAGNGAELELVYAGLGRAADFAGRNVRNKAVVLFSMPAPGVRDHSTQWTGALQRAQDAGAAALLVVLGLPGNITTLMRDRSSVPAFSLGSGDGDRILNALDRSGAGQGPRIRLRVETQMVPNLKTGSVWGTLPGTSDENIVLIAHHDGYFEAAYDNASGMATTLGLAEYYAKLPAAARKRGLIFVATPAHHAGDPGVRWMHDHRETFFAKTALILCAEHPSVTEAYLHGPYLRKSNLVAAKRWAVWGSPRLEQILVRAFDAFGVATYAEPDTRAGGALSPVRYDAPSFMFNDAGTFYHSDHDRDDIVPAPGLESATRAFAKIIEEANRLSIRELVGPPPPPDPEP